MRPQFIIITDRGTMKAAWISPTLPNRPPQLKVVEELAFVGPHQHYVEQVTDMAGVYAAAESSSGQQGGQPRRAPSSISEVHWKIEADRRAVEDLVGAITKVLEREKPEFWSLSIPRDIHNMLVERLPQIYRDRLVRVLPKDLVRADPENIFAHFLPSPRPERA